MDQLGRFKLRGELGSGLYTRTYEASDGRQRCVVKVIKDDAVPRDPARRAGLVRALAGLRRIEHPSAVRILDGGEVGGKLYFAREFMDSPTLEDKLRQQAALSEQQAVLYLRQSAQALDKARDLGYCHGSLTARNVFVVSEEKVKLADFAIQALVEDPPEATAIEFEGDKPKPAAEQEWVTAEDLLRSKGKKTLGARLDDDLVGLAVLMMRMLGARVPERRAGEFTDAYRDRLLREAYPRLGGGAGAASVHSGEVVRRLLTAGGFDSPGEVVVELASAMLLGRTFTRPKVASAGEPTPAAETAQVPAPLDDELEQMADESDFGSPTPVPVGGLETPEGVEEGVTVFFIWKDRRSGTFFVIHDGEQISLGRDPELSDVVLLDPSVSRKHCILSKRDGIVRIEDLGSSNGTFINDQRVTSAVIQRGDKVRLGTTRVYTFLPGRGP